MQKFIYRSLINKPIDEIVKWHLREKVLERSFGQASFLQVFSSLDPDQNRQGRIKWGFFTFRMLVSYEQLGEDRFVLKQKQGPFKKFEVLTSINALGSISSEVIETVLFKLPYHMRGVDVCKRLKKCFTFKHEIMDHDLDLFTRYRFQNSLRILITGASGFLARELAQFFKTAGHTPISLVRQKKRLKKDAIYFNQDGQDREEDSFEGFDVVINLAGENLASGRWTDEKKKKIFSSRVDFTEKLVTLLSDLKNPPKTFLSASAVGFYKDQGKKKVDESGVSNPSSFLAEICRSWEDACLPLKARGTRVANMRFGMILSASGGALKKLLLPFRLGLGGRLGTGQHYMSWLTIDDLIGAVYHLIMEPELEGAFNFTAVESLKNEEFTKALVEALGRFEGPPIPAFFLHFLYGQMADEVLLFGVRAEPKRLLDSGYRFYYPTLRRALKHLL
ncbi:MAG: TIGR01777 family oxidoreductase [Simkaniaceae bacterium]